MDIDVWVTTLKGRVLYHRHGTEKGMISFMTPKSEHLDLDDDDEEDNDTFRVCLEHQLRPSETLTQGAKRLVSYRLDKAQHKLRGFQSHATLRHAHTLTERLREIHTALSNMMGDLSFLEQRERRLLERNRLTLSRISFLASLSLIVMVATSCIQLTYYRQFFQVEENLVIHELADFLEGRSRCTCPVLDNRAMDCYCRVNRRSMLQGGDSLFDAVQYC